MTDHEAVNPERAFLSELEAELPLLTTRERDEQKALIAELAAELAMAEAMQAETDEYIARARLWDQPETPKTPTQPFTFDFAKIGWLDDDSTRKIRVAEVATPSLKYLFVDFTNDHPVTRRAGEHLQREGIKDKLVDSIVKEKIPIMWQEVLAGKGSQRSISIGNRDVKDVQTARSLNTTLPAYKIDVLGTSNRAIIVKLGDVGKKPVFALGAVYDHEDQERVLQTLFLKHK